jgi:hypothetical protein
VGYLSDNIPAGANHVICQDLYQFRIFIEPKFASDFKLASIVKDEIPDVEEWQFSGRRRNRAVPSRGSSRAIRRTIHPATIAQNSRRIRPFTEEVVFAFHTELQRTQVAARLTNEGFKFRLVDEPTSSAAGAMIIIVI